MTDLPESPEAGPVEEETRSAARQVALGLIAFVATLALLFGLATLASNSEPRPRVSGSPSARTAVGSVASASPLSSARFSPSPSRAGDSDPVLIGAGDIADCGRDA